MGSLSNRNDLFPVSFALALRQRQSHKLSPFGAVRPLNRCRDMTGTSLRWHQCHFVNVTPSLIPVEQGLTESIEMKSKLTRRFS